MSAAPPSSAGATGLRVLLRGGVRRPGPFLPTAAVALVVAALRLGALVEAGWNGEGRKSVAPDGSAAGAGRHGVIEEVVVALLDLVAPSRSVEPAAGPEGAEAGAGGPGPADPLADAAAELARRSAELDRRERELALREAAALVVETRLSEQLARLETLKKELEETAARIRAQDEAELAQLVKTYEAMKARAAAQVFDQLPLEVLMPIVRRMREGKLAAVLGAMDPGKAKQITAALARTTPLPSLP